MNNQKKQHMLKELAFKKDLALAASEKHFPSQFYKFSEMVLTNPIFKKVAQRIQGEVKKDCSEYYKTINNIDKLIDVILGPLLEHITGINVETAYIVAGQLRLLATGATDKHVALVVQRAFIIQRIIKNLSDDSPHNAFLKKISKDIESLNCLLEDFKQENDYVRRIANVRWWGSLQRIFRICQIYNPEWYKAVRDDLIKARRNLDLLTLDMQYAGLQRCIDPGGENDSYDANFDMAADKLAIQEIYACIERQAGEDDPKKAQSDGLSKKIKVIAKNNRFLQIAVGDDKRNIKVKSDLGKTIDFFSKSRKCDGKKIYSIKSGAKSTESLGPSELKQVDNLIKNVNKYFNKFEITAALNTKTIDSYHGKKLEISKNPQYWE